MDFSSLPSYLDSSNWHPHQEHPGGSGSNSSTNPPPSSPPPPLPPPPPPQPHASSGCSTGSVPVRPAGSMMERARMANVPMPEAALKCPRCDSTNTKFCYFNNYSLSQPRHFCKTCRRYWTRGGSLRNVPVGGGFRRNKRSNKTNRSKSPVGPVAPAPTTSTAAALPSYTGQAADILGLGQPMKFGPPFNHRLSDYDVGDMGLNFAGDMTFPPCGGSSFVQGGGVGWEPWRLTAAQQFPFMGGVVNSCSGLEPAAGMGLMYPFDIGGSCSGGGSGEPTPGYLGIQSRPSGEGSSVLRQQMAAVKIEDARERDVLNLSSSTPQQMLGLGMNNIIIPGGLGNDQYQWTDMSGFSSSSTSDNPL